MRPDEFATLVALIEAAAVLNWRPVVCDYLDGQPVTLRDLRDADANAVARHIDTFTGGDCTLIFQHPEHRSQSVLLVCGNEPGVLIADHSEGKGTSWPELMGTMDRQMDDTDAKWRAGELDAHLPDCYRMHPRLFGLFLLNEEGTPAKTAYATSAAKPVLEAKGNSLGAPWVILPV